MPVPLVLRKLCPALGLACVLLLDAGCDKAGSIAIRPAARMQADPQRAPADGRPAVEVSVWVTAAGDEESPLQGVVVEIRSLRNAGGEMVDTIEQPLGPTDADGRAVAFVGSEQLGRAELSAWSAGAPLCAAGGGADCQPASVVVEFTADCPAGLTACGDGCVDTDSDPDHCGGCGRVCAYPHAEGLCSDGACSLGPCDLGWGDCNRQAADGCEQDLAEDQNHCGSCDHACQPGQSCEQGICTSDCPDADGDGFADHACGGLDCDDSAADVHPDADEVCDNGRDDDCDGLTDGDDPECVPCERDADCDDGDVCTGQERCVDGYCQAGQPPDCDDANPCTNDACDPQVGCVHNDNTAPCDDGDACTMADHCAGGACVGEPLDADLDGYVAADCGGLDCDDGDAAINPDGFEAGPDSCADGRDNDCDGLTDGDDPGCQPCQQDSDCDDDNACNGQERCVDGDCAAGSPLDCDDGNPCTTDSCVPASGCTNTPNERPCNDGDACTVDDVCSGGSCQPGTARDCDDGNPCTDDGCDPASGCFHDHNAAPCDDGDACTVDDTCSGGACYPGPALDCDDGNPCTSDDCNPDSGCVHGNLDIACDDGDACTLGDACVDGVCQPGAQRQCDDGNPCTDDSCDPASGCVYSPNSQPCDDGDACTVDDACTDGACQPGPVRDCDDGNPCTDDSCDAAIGCVNDFNTAPCDDGDPCTVDDTCHEGSCAGQPLDADGDGYVPEACGGGDCDDGDPNVHPNVFEGPAGAAVCADGIDNDCDGLIDLEEDSCGNCNEAADCDDGNVCNGVETCDAGSCTAGTPLDCSDGNPCTDDLCDPVDGCSNPDNTDACDDGDACTVDDRCSGGACQPGDPRTCNDGEDCTDDDCDPDSGCIFTPNDDNACDDGDPCTVDDHCAGGSCTASVLRDRDGDGFVDEACGGTDCDDLDPDINTAATEVCDGADNDCDGLLDQRLCTNQEGVCAGSLQQCVSGVWAPCNYAAQPDYEHHEVTCDGLDNDCDSCSDEGCAGNPEPVVAAEVVPFTTGPGLRRLSGNGQAAPVGALLPNPLLIQLNDADGQPRPNTEVTFRVEPVGAVCYGAGGTYDPVHDHLDTMAIRMVCNDVGSSSLVGPARVYTDELGQARVQLRLGADLAGLSAVTAEADDGAGGTAAVTFFATGGGLLADAITLPDEGYSPTANPALGPLNVTVRPGGSSADFLSNPDNYTLLVTGVSASTGASADGVAQAPLAAGGELTLSGMHFSASGNSVWIAGTPAAVLSEGADSITVAIPEGSPGAASLIVDDGSSTPFADGSGDVPSVASCVANFQRLAPKPIYIHADTGSQPGSQAAVRLLGRDRCGNPLDIADESVSLWTENPDGSGPADAVAVSWIDQPAGLARVAPTGAATRSALVKGSVAGLSSDDVPGGHVTVTPVAWTRAPAAFTDAGVGNAGGINSIVFRGGPGGPGETDTALMNPAVRFADVDISPGVLPDGLSGPDFETEAHLSAATMIGEGDMAHVPGGEQQAAMAGSGLLVRSGSADGLLATVSANASYCIRILFIWQCGEMPVEGIALPGWFTQAAGVQQLELSHSGLMYYDVDEHRNLIMRLLVERSLP